MKRTISLVIILSVGVAQAAQIHWRTSKQIRGDSDVSTNGTLVLALNIGAPGGVTTVNGVDFLNVNLAGANARSGFSTTVGNFAISKFGVGNVTDAATRALIISGTYGSGSVEFSGLVIGDTYEIQLFSNDARSKLGRNSKWRTLLGNGLGRSLADVRATSAFTILNNSDIQGSAGYQGSYIIGTFKADATTQSFFLGGTHNGGVSFAKNRAQINAIQLRSVAAVPEPASYALLSTGFNSFDFL